MYDEKKCLLNLNQTTTTYHEAQVSSDYSGVITSQNNPYNRNVHTPQRVLLPILIWAHDIYNLYRNLYHVFECSGDSTDSHSQTFSIWQLNWHRQSSPWGSNRITHDWWPCVDKTNHICNVISDDESWRWAIMILWYVFLRAVRFQL